MYESSFCKQGVKPSFDTMTQPFYLDHPYLLVKAASKPPVPARTNDEHPLITGLHEGRCTSSACATA